MVGVLAAALRRGAGSGWAPAAAALGVAGASAAAVSAAADRGWLWRGEEGSPALAALAAVRQLPGGVRTAVAEAEARSNSPLIFSGTANQPLSNEVAKQLGVSLGSVTINRYADGEKAIHVHTSVRNRHVFVLQASSPPVNENIMELFLMISTLKRASAKSVTAVIPYYGYARADRKTKPRVPISAADVAHLLEAVGVDRVLSVDLHCGQIQGFFGPTTPVDNLYGATVAYPYVAGKGLRNVCVVSPDAGGVTRAKKFRDGLKELGVQSTFAMIIKERLQANQVAGMDLVGSVEGCDVIIVDDLIDTAGTLCKAAAELKKKGAKRVTAFATHPVFSRDAVEKIEASVLDEVVVLDTIPLSAERLKASTKVTQLSCAPLIAEAIHRVNNDGSLSELF